MKNTPFDRSLHVCIKFTGKQQEQKEKEEKSKVNSESASHCVKHKSTSLLPFLLLLLLFLPFYLRACLRTSQCRWKWSEAEENNSNNNNKKKAVLAKREEKKNRKSLSDAEKKNDAPRCFRALLIIPLFFGDSEFFFFCFFFKNRCVASFQNHETRSNWIAKLKKEKGQNSVASESNKQANKRQKERKKRVEWTAKENRREEQCTVGIGVFLLFKITRNAYNTAAVL